MKSLKPVVAITVLVVAVMVMGGFFVVFFDGSSYGATCTRDGDTLRYSVTSAGADTYGVVVAEGTCVTDLYIYVDDAYGSESVRGDAPVGSIALTPSRFASELRTVLSDRDFTNVHTVDAKGLSDLCSDTSYAKGRGVVCVSGLLPDTVYDGTKDSSIIKWLSAGGTLYWAANVIGVYVGHSGSDPTVVKDGYKFFLGDSAVVQDSEDAYGDSAAGDFTSLIGLRGNSLEFAPVTSTLVNPVVSGYTDGRCSSVTFSPLGSGQVCIMGGGLVFDHYRDLAQIVCAGVSAYTHLVAHASGEVVRGTVSGTVTLPSSSPAVHVYVFIGKGVDYTVYGKVFSGVTA